MIHINQGIVSSIDDDGVLTVNIGQVNPVEVSSFKNSKPQIGDMVVFGKVAGDSNDLIPLLLVNEVIHDIESGEEILSATKDNETVSSIKVKVSGDVVMNDGEDYAVAFSKLKTEFNELKGKFNDSATSLTAHIHSAPSGATGTPVDASLVAVVIQPSTADIDNVKVEKVRL